METTDFPLHKKLAQAVGAVAMESACLDELLREFLTWLIDSDDAYVLFQGQSNEWLAWACKETLHQADSYYRRWNADLHRKFNEQIDALRQLRELRNLVIHGTWSEYYHAEEPRPRPWGPRDDTKVFYCSKSQARKIWTDETCLTISDVRHLGILLRDAWKNLKLTYDEMFYPEGRENEFGPLARWVDKSPQS